MAHKPLENASTARELPETLQLTLLIISFISEEATSFPCKIPRIRLARPQLLSIPPRTYRIGPLIFTFLEPTFPLLNQTGKLQAPTLMMMDYHLTIKQNTTHTHSSLHSTAKTYLLRCLLMSRLKVKPSLLSLIALQSTIMTSSREYSSTMLITSRTTRPTQLMLPFKTIHHLLLEMLLTVEIARS
jgi:hypothetical protein